MNEEISGKYCCFLFFCLRELYPKFTNMICIAYIYLVYCTYLIVYNSPNKFNCFMCLLYSFTSLQYNSTSWIGCWKTKAIPILSSRELCLTNNYMYTVLHSQKNRKCLFLNPLNPHDASNHHFAYLKIDSIFFKPMGFRLIFLLEQLNNNNIFFAFATHFKSSASASNCASNSRLVVDEDDNGKFRLKMVK